MTSLMAVLSVGTEASRRPNVCDRPVIVHHTNRVITPPPPAAERVIRSARHQVGRMLMTLATTTTTTASEISDCSAMSALARVVSGMVSVGLKATALVKAR